MLGVGDRREYPESVSGLFQREAEVSLNSSTDQKRVYRIIYVGPEGSGKTTTLLSIHRLAEEPTRGPLRYVFSRLIPKSTLDLLVLNLGRIQGTWTRVRLYAVPGRKQAERVLQRILPGASCVVFVADSQIANVGQNLDFIYNYRTTILNEAGRKRPAPPMVYQFNKADLPSIVEPQRLAEILGTGDDPYYTTAALIGAGVFLPLKAAIEKSMSFVESLKSEVGTPA